MAEVRGEMSVREAGRKGGQTTKSKYGSKFYEEIGRKGGLATARTHGHEFYEEIGRKGGKIGGPKGGARVRELIERGKKALEASETS